MTDGTSGREPKQLPEFYDDDVLGFEYRIVPEDGLPPARVYSLVYPPIGFFPFYGTGDGDYYGYYWPLGREEKPPLIASTNHGVGSLVPENSQIDRFYLCQLARIMNDPDEDVDDSLASSAEQYKSLVEAATGESQPHQPSRRIHADDFRTLLEVDPDSPFFLTAVGDLYLLDNDLEEAVSSYLIAIDRLPEYVAAHFGLAMAYRRLRQPEKSLPHLREALVGTQAFYGGSFWAETWLPGGEIRNDWRRKSLLWLQQGLRRAKEIEDPFLKAVGDLQFQSGVKESGDFSIMENLIEEYLDLEEPIEAVKIWMLYGQRAAEETVSFRERLGLTPQGYGTRLVELLERANLQRRASLVRDMIARLDSPEGLYL